MRPGPRALLLALTVLPALVTPCRATGFPLSSDPAPLAMCAETIRKGAAELEGDARQAISACLTRGIECVVGSVEARQACCTRAHGRCTNDFADVIAAKRRFTTIVGNRRCASVPSADVVSPSGLGYGKVDLACAAFAPPVSIADLGGLADCLARLDVSRTACLIGTKEEPRSAEALECMGLQEAFRIETDADLAACGTSAPPPPPPPCAPGAQIIVVASLDQSYAGAQVELAYPDSVSIPGSATAQTVLDRVQFAAGGLTAVNDADVDGDAVDDTLRASLVGLEDNAAGPFVTVTFDCAAGRVPPSAADFQCAVPSASTSGGVPVEAHCALVLP